MPDQQVLTFDVNVKGQFVYILWPWSSVDEFLYESLALGAKYKMRPPPKLSRYFWIEFVSVAGTHGEYPSSLYFGNTLWGPRVFRQFNARSTHYLAQHGLDGLPKKLWDAAYEYESGEPMGQVKFNFKVSGKGAYFAMTFWDWMQYFTSGRNGPVKDMAINIINKEVKPCKLL